MLLGAHSDRELFFRRNLMNDTAIRLAAVAAARSLVARWGDAVQYSELVKGFVVDGQRVLLMSKAEGGLQAGAADARGAVDLVEAEGPLHRRAGVGHAHVLRLLAEAGAQPVDPGRDDHGRGRHLPAAGKDQAEPGVRRLRAVRIVEDDPERRRFVVDLSPMPKPLYDPSQLRVGVIPRLYDSATVKVRLFQAHFRRVVLDAYQNRCCVCSLPERPLLDGAQITPDSDEAGEPVVNNGLALCALHHRAFDAEMMAVDSNYTVIVRDERLAHPADPANRVLLDFHGKPIRLPREDSLWPDRERLERRGSDTGM